MKKILTVFAITSVITSVHAGMDDDPVLGKVMIDQLETRRTEGNDPWVLEADAWIGKDWHKAWFKADVEYVDSETEQADVQARYSRAIAPFWDFQLGLRHDFKPDEETRDWAVLGFRGLAPYFFDMDAAFYVGENGRTQLSFDTEYEIMLTQRWVLAPELQVNLFGKKDPARGHGSGLSDLELGLRLRYEIRREFAPYIGMNLESKWGGTADLAKDEGKDTRDIQYVAGIRAWF